MTMTDCRIYVASLADYNGGILHGRWIDVTDERTMREEIEAMLAESPTAKAEGYPAEDWAIHDYEGFGPVRLSETEDLAWLVTLAEAAEDHGEAFLAWVAHESCNTDPWEFENEYMGEWDSLADYVQDFWEQTGETPKATHWWHPAHYTDWERMAHDLEISGDVWTLAAPGGSVWVFSNH